MPRHKLIAILGQPENAQRMNDAEWNAVIRAARQTDLLGQLGGTIYDVMPPENIPPPVKRAIDLEILTARRRGEAALWEIRVMRRLIPDDIPIIVLKGCAYVLANDKNSDALGVPGGTRTPDLLLRRQLLYPVELRALEGETGRNWSGRWDSNSRPSAPKADALPDCATPRHERPHSITT
jgi:hypothetical protein